MNIFVRFYENAQPLWVEFGTVHTVTDYANEPYIGNYSVTPQITDQALPTKDKVLVEDIRISAIPYAEVSNVSNGITVTIA